jgi:hypothetical protein
MSLFARLFPSRAKINKSRRTLAHLRYDSNLGAYRLNQQASDEVWKKALKAAGKARENRKSRKIHTVPVASGFVKVT